MHLVASETTVFLFLTYHRRTVRSVPMISDNVKPVTLIFSLFLYIFSLKMYEYFIFFLCCFSGTVFELVQGHSVLSAVLF